jgi:hypothetical protein
MKIKKLDINFTVCKIKDLTGVNFTRDFVFAAKTDEEISLVCETQYVPANTAAKEDGFLAFRIEGILDFSLTGVISKISAVLAEAKIGVFVVSTYNTDYVFVKSRDFERSVLLLENEGYICE